jgi:hypothetical protein
MKRHTWLAACSFAFQASLGWKWKKASIFGTGDEFKE